MSLEQEMEDSYDQSVEALRRIAEKHHTCRWCGEPSEVDPSDQTPPPDYCHPDDHGAGRFK